MTLTLITIYSLKHSVSSHSNHPDTVAFPHTLLTSVPLIPFIVKVKPL